MDAYQQVPVKAAEQIGINCAKQIVVIVAWDEACGRIHTTTWGLAARHKEWAAELGPILAKAAGGVPELAEHFADFRSPSEAARFAEIIGDIEAMRQIEGNSVTINCDNPEADRIEKHSAVDVCGDFTSYRAERFYGKTWTEALHRAADHARAFYSIEG